MTFSKTQSVKSRYLAKVSGLNNRFISIRWKLVSTYLLLIMMTLFLMNSFIQASLTNSALQQRRAHLLTQGNIIANRVGPNLYAIEKEHTRLYLEKIVINLSMDLKSRVMVTDLDGLVLIDSYEEYLGRNLRDVREVSKALDGFSEVNQYKADDVGRVVYVGVPLLDKGNLIGAVLVVSSLEELFADIGATMSKFITLSLVSIILTGVVSFFFADVIATPGERLTEVVNGVAKGRMDLRASETGNDEMAKLSGAFNLMIARLEQIEDQRKQFVSNVSHELRTPLSSIKILSESLLHNKGADIEVYHEFLTDINGEVDRLNNIINSLLYLVDLEKEGMKLDCSSVNLSWLTGNVIAFMMPLAQQKSLQLTYLEKDQIKVCLDKEKIRQCLINIIANAIKFTPEGGEITVAISQNKDFATIEVSDTGIGIPKDKLHLIFDRFYRVDEARARNTGGSGLGLAISQQIIHLHHGHIDVTSGESGTRFFLNLPFGEGCAGGEE